MEELVRAINKMFGDGRISGAVFFEHRPDGSVDKMNPLFADADKLTIPMMVERLENYAAACKYMADDFKRRFPDRFLNQN